MSSILQDSVSDDALLKTYRGGARPERWGHHGDCFSVTVDRTVSLFYFVFALYTSRVFRIERLILALVVRAPSTDAQAHAVAASLDRQTGLMQMGTGFRVLMGFHILYEADCGYGIPIPLRTCNRSSFDCCLGCKAVAGGTVND